MSLLHSDCVSLAAGQFGVSSGQSESEHVMDLQNGQGVKIILMNIEYEHFELVT